MARFPAVAVAILAILTPLATARGCSTGLKYCGRTLQDIEALRDAGQQVTSQTVENSLFYCAGGANGDILYIETCKKCIDGTHNDDDFCV
ncbi:hypothetical protein MKX08_000216 [Trichoderma sp. CBMAI-0020]|nr:hypothetical protein MKX08_000216 [Trichoderma sp. CBMAI-0020]